MENKNQKTVGPMHSTNLKTPVGMILISATPKGICQLSFEQTPRQNQKNTPRLPETDRFGLSGTNRFGLSRTDDLRLSEAKEQIKAYFKGDLQQFSLPLDLQETSPFTVRVLKEVSKIPFGSLVNYGELASRIGSPSASRAVGGALGRNPIPIIIPCHRVITKSGHIGGFSAGKLSNGLSIKKTLLKYELFRGPHSNDIPVFKGLRSSDIPNNH